LVWPDGDALARLRSAAVGYKELGRDLLNRNPLESLLALVLGGAAVYYVAERGRNEKVHHYWDALEFVSTCASVGYSNIFPSTPAGKIVASILFLLGPSLTSRALDPSGESAPADPNSSSQALVAKLDELLLELRKLNSRVDGFGERGEPFAPEC
jgi:hypothetical protein